MQVVIIDYGAGNLFSVAKAFERLGIVPVISSDPRVIASADRVIFPGVGHAKSAMEALKKTGLDTLIPSLKQPVLGICLGMQLMCEWTEEGEVTGLGIFRTNVRSLKTQYYAFATESGNSKNLQFPHMGWNDVDFNGQQEAFYFVHNYAAELCEDTWGIGDYGLQFSAALKRDNFYGVQFHPEKSGEAGEGVIRHFLEGDLETLQLI